MAPSDGGDPGTEEIIRLSHLVWERHGIPRKVEMKLKTRTSGKLHQYRKEYNHSTGSTGKLICFQTSEIELPLSPLAVLTKCMVTLVASQQEKNADFTPNPEEFDWLSALSPLVPQNAMYSIPATILSALAT